MGGYVWDFSVVWEDFPLMLEGLKVTILLTIASMGLGVVFGLVASLGRLTKRGPIKYLATAYVELFRTTPLLVQIWWVYYVLPLTTGLSISNFGTALLAYSLNVGAFLCEVFRAGIMSISRGQRDGAFALGMTNTQVMRRIVLPQAIRRMIPPIGSTWVGLFKDTALVSAIGVADLMNQAKTVAVNTYRPLEAFTIAALLYFIVTYPQAMGVEYLFRRFRVRD